MNTQQKVIEALTNGTPFVVAEVADLIGAEATTLSGQPFGTEDADFIDHYSVDRAPVIDLVAELNAWQTVADHLSI